MTDQMSERDSAPESKDRGGQRPGSGIRGATGQDLRERREALGWNLGEISDVLRIRQEYLEALENGDYGVLPGHTYAVGFVRTYASHLGLDGNQAARQFKIEISAERPTARLDFPEPMSESRIPTGAIVMVTVLLAAAIYGVWYYLNARDLGLSDIVPDVPGRFVADTGSPAPPPPSPIASAPVEAPSEAEPLVTTAQPDEDAPAADAVSAQAPPQISEPAPEPQAAFPASQPAGEPVAGPTTDPPAAPEASQPVPEIAFGQTSALPPERPTAIPPEPPARAPRIEIRAVADSWVQIRDGDGSLLMTRIMTAGSNYVVPAEPGLTLMTGNAGGLEILVDGATIPALGPFGAVRRNIALDPERLKAGSAGQR